MQIFFSALCYQAHILLLKISDHVSQPNSVLEKRWDNSRFELNSNKFPTVFLCCYGLRTEMCSSTRKGTYNLMWDQDRCVGLCTSHSQSSDFTANNERKRKGSGTDLAGSNQSRTQRLLPYFTLKLSFISMHISGIFASSIIRRCLNRRIAAGKCKCKWWVGINSEVVVS